MKKLVAIAILTVSAVVCQAQTAHLAATLDGNQLQLPASYSAPVTLAGGLTVTGQVTVVVGPEIWNFMPTGQLTSTNTLTGARYSSGLTGHPTWTDQYSNTISFTTNQVSFVYGTNSLVFSNGQVAVNGTVLVNGDTNGAATNVLGTILSGSNTYTGNNVHSGLTTLSNVNIAAGSVSPTGGTAVVTNDTRSLSLTNTANKLAGLFVNSSAPVFVGNYASNAPNFTPVNAALAIDSTSGYEWFNPGGGTNWTIYSY